VVLDCAAGTVTSARHDATTRVAPVLAIFLFCLIRCAGI
jgi:hypothetical protein